MHLPLSGYGLGLPPHSATSPRVPGLCFLNVLFESRPHPCPGIYTSFSPKPLTSCFHLVTLSEPPLGPLLA